MHEPLEDTRDWDRFYTADGDDTAHWSGQPNPSLVDEVSSLPPGTALDVGCGEGADAIWLARRGWQVTAIDPSRVALARAEAAARAVGAEVAWVHSGLLEMPGGRTYDLVAAHYPVLRKDDGRTITTLIEAVRPGGTLLFVHHERESEHARAHGFDIAEHVMPGDVSAALNDEWEIDVFEFRTRDAPSTRAGQAPRDLVLRAHRRS